MHVKELDRYISDWMSEHSLEEVSELLHKESVPMGPVYNIQDIMENIHAQFREMVTTVVDNGKKIKTENIFPKFSRTPEI